jgi:photosystem II stability/assembly factor-like uncharacterized protein
VVDTQHAFVVTSGGRVSKTTDSGRSWTTTQVHNNALNAVDFISPSAGWVTGNGGRVYRTTDGGATWTEPSGGVVGSGGNFSSIDFLNGYFGLVSQDYYGNVYKTMNGGTSWTAIPLPSAAYHETLSRVKAISETDYRVTTHSAYYRSQNAGATWTRVALPCSGVRAMTFASPLVGWIAGNSGCVARTTDGGTTWSTQNSNTGSGIYSLFALSENHVWYAGTSGVVGYTTNGGSAWYAGNGLAGKSETVLDIAASNTRNVWAISERGGVFRSFSGGAVP